MSCDTNQVMSFQDYFDAICFWSAHPALDNVAYDPLSTGSEMLRRPKRRLLNHFYGFILEPVHVV